MQYNNKLSLYGPSFIENEIGEKEQTFVKIKDIYCKIVPNHGGESNIGSTDVKDSSTGQTILCRKLSIKNPKISMYFIDANGWKYEIIDFFPGYKDNEFWEFKTKIVREE